jgi:3-oxoacyl-[acyl-carrier-protein] synthase I
MSQSSVVITGMGFVSSIGCDTEAVVDHLRRGRHGFSRVELRQGVDLPIKVVGTVPGYAFPSPDVRDWVLPPESHVDLRREPSLPPHGVYAVDAVEQAIAQAGLTSDQLGDGSTGLFGASSGSPMLLRHHLSVYDKDGSQRGHPLGVVRSVAGTLNFNLAARYGIRGASCGFVSACASSSHALGSAYDEIVLGRQDQMIVVGAEECAAESILPFDAMRALSTHADPDMACRPFDQARDGFVVSGGAVALVLERASLAKRAPLARLLGWGQAADGYHVASPHPEGIGIVTAMKRALQFAKVDEAAIDYVNAHATSTPAGDRAEALALRSVFGSASPAVVSTKGLTGHGLSLSGVLEAALTVLSLRGGFLPGNRNLKSPDEACEGLCLPTESMDADVKLAINNSSGFGGANVCHVLAQP